MKINISNNLLVALVLIVFLSLQSSYASPTEKTLHQAAQDGDLETIEELVAQGIDINELKNGKTALYLALSYGGEETANKLISLGANLQSIVNGKMPIHYTSINNQANVMRKLLHLNAPIERKDNEGRTPLHYAAAGGNLAVLKMLLKRGASVAVFDNESNTPIVDSLRNAHARVFDELLFYVQFKESVYRILIQEKTPQENQPKMFKVLIKHIIRRSDLGVRAPRCVCNIVTDYIYESTLYIPAMRAITSSL